MKSIGLYFLLYLHMVMEESIMDLVMEVSFMDRILEMSLSQVSRLICEFCLWGLFLWMRVMFLNSIIVKGVLALSSLSFLGSG